MGSGFRKIHQMKDSFLKRENFFVNEFWQFGPEAAKPYVR